MTSRSRKRSRQFGEQTTVEATVEAVISVLGSIATVEVVASIVGTTIDRTIEKTEMATTGEDIRGEASTEVALDSQKTTDLDPKLTTVTFKCKKFLNTSNGVMNILVFSFLQVLISLNYLRFLF